MQEGCFRLCPKVRQQLRRDRGEASEESSSEDSLSDLDFNEPVAGPSYIQSPKKTPPRRSKDSSNKYFPSATVSPTRIIRTPRRSHESGGKSPRAYRHGEREPDEYRSGASSRADSREKISNGPATRRAAPATFGKPRKEKQLKSGKTQNRYREFDEGAGPSRDHRAKRDFEDDEESINAHIRCDPDCRGIDERMRRVRDERQREILDQNLLYKGLPYFGDLCYCSYECLAKQLWSDNFVKSTVTSIGLFTIGIKLFFDLDGWTVPNTF